MFHLARVLGRAAAIFAQRTAVVDGSVVLSYAELAQRVDALARGLAARGVRPGDRVALLARNGFRTMEAHYAAAALEAILVPLNVRLAVRELLQITDETEPVLALVDDELRPLLDDRLPCGTWRLGDPPGARNAYESLLADGAPLPRVDRDPAAIAQIFYTSGTSGEPKGVCLSNTALVASAFDSIAALELNRDDVWLHAAPMFHLVDAFAIWAITMVGGRHVIEHFVPAAFAEVVARERITKTSLPPTLIALASEHAGEADPRFASLDRVSYGGAPMAEATHRRASAVMGAQFLQAYGITETSGLVCQQLPGDYRPEDSGPAGARLISAGLPAVSIDLRIVDDDGRDVAHGAVGEILVAGPRVMTAYWRKPDLTRLALPDGWYRSGDLGRRDADGHLFIAGRKKDMIITGGENVYPAEVENVLMLHPAIAEVAVFGIPSERWGEEVRAAVVLRTGSSVDADALRAFCRERLGGYKVPKSYQFATEPLPKTGPGKVAKHLLRAPFWDRVTGERV